MFNNKTILITGGTGSFGKKYTELLIQNYQPKKIIIFSRDELKQFEMNQIFNQDIIQYIIGDVRDFDSVNKAMQNVDYVIHAAALKQVPIAEHNPMECIKTNIYGAENIIKSSLANNVKKVIALSTDKAANPINLYGATKLASDKLFVAANNLSQNNQTIFSVVRYGNVINSRGSVVPFFQKLINQGCKILPITHEKMTRFLITLTEGVNFVFKNFQRMQGGEIFIPKIPSIRIIDLVKALSETASYEIVGIRPGEKLHEIMCPSDDSHLTLEFSDHFVIKPTIKLNKKINFNTNSLNEKGISVKSGFEYNSGNNTQWLDSNSFKSMLEIA